MSGAPRVQTHTAHQPMKHTGGHGMEAPKPGDVSCQPTWAQPSIDGSSIYIACNASSEIVEINAGTWKPVRRVPARAGVYNLAITRDGARLCDEQT